MKDITITVPRLESKYTKRESPMSIPFQEIALELAMEMGKQVMIKIFKEVDDGLMKERNKVDLKNQELRARYLTTRLGDIRFKRRAYYDKGIKIERKERCLAKSELEAKESSPVRDMVIVEVDGTPIHLQKKDRKIYHRRMTEVRLGTAYTGWERRYKGGKGKSMKLKEKYVYAEVGESGSGFMERSELECVKKGMKYPEQRYLL